MKPFTLVYGNELVPSELPDLPIQEYAADEKLLGELITATTFLPRVQLMGGTTELAKQGLIGPGRYALIRSKDSFDDLGQQVVCLPLSMRFKAMRIPGDGNVFSYHNPMTEEFKKVMADSELENSGCMYGLEFLAWFPEQRLFATVYLNSKTNRRQAPAFKALMQEKKGATLKVEFIKKGKHSWHGMVITQCSTPFELPPLEDILLEAERFAKPKDSTVEKADVASRDR